MTRYERRWFNYGRADALAGLAAHPDRRPGCKAHRAYLKGHATVSA